MDKIDLGNKMSQLDHDNPLIYRDILSGYQDNDTFDNDGIFVMCYEYIEKSDT